MVDFVTCYVQSFRFLTTLLNEVRPNLEFISKLGNSIESGDFFIDINVAIYSFIEIICSKWSNFVFIQVTLLFLKDTPSKHRVLTPRGTNNKQLSSLLSYGARSFAAPPALKNQTPPAEQIIGPPPLGFWSLPTYGDEL